MKAHRAYLCVSQTAFLVACLFGLSYALSYLRFVQENHWLAWTPGIGIALLFASMVMSYVGQMQSARRPGGHERYFHLCLAAFVVACCLGMNLAMTYLHLVHQNGWTAWKPGVGVALLFLSMTLSYIGFATSVRRSGQPSAAAV